MGVSRSPEELGRKLARAGYAIGAANRAAVSGAAFVYKRRLLENAERDAGPDRRLSRWRRRSGTRSSGESPRLNAGYDLFGYENAVAVLRPRPYGIWALLEGGAAPHRIQPHSTRRRAATVKALRFPGGGFAAYADHPGTEPKHTFTDAISGEESAAMAVFAAAHRRSLLETFR